MGLYAKRTEVSWLKSIVSIPIYEVSQQHKMSGTDRLGRTDREITPIWGLYANHPPSIYIYKYLTNTQKICVLLHEISHWRLHRSRGYPYFSIGSPQEEKLCDKYALRLLARWYGKEWVAYYKKVFIG